MRYCVTVSHTHAQHNESRFLYSTERGAKYVAQTDHRAIAFVRGIHARCFHDDQAVRRERCVGVRVYGSTVTTERSDDSICRRAGVHYTPTACAEIRRTYSR